MNKPITMIINDLKQEIIDTINNSKLPFVITEYVLTDILKDVHAMEIRQLQLDTENYNKYLNEQANKKEVGI